MTQVREIMTSDPTCLFGTNTVTEAAQQMRDSNFGDVLVVAGDDLLGLITDRDIAVRVVAEGIDPETTSLKDVCTTELITVDADGDAHEAVTLMREKAVRRLPVIEDGRPVGIISLGDLATVLDERSALAQISSAPPNL